MTNIELTPIRTSDTQDLSVISPNTQTLFAPKATVEKSDDYGVVSYTDIGNFVNNYTYSKEEIDIKDDEVLRDSKEYTAEYTYDKNTIDKKDSELNNKIDTKVTLISIGDIILNDKHYENFFTNTGTDNSSNMVYTINSNGTLTKKSVSYAFGTRIYLY